MAKASRLKPAHLIGHLHLLWHAALEQQEDGNLAKWSDDLICDLSGSPCDAPQWVRLLQDHGWLDSGRLLHDWPDYAGAYLRGKYAKDHREKLVVIWALHGRTYGNPTEAQPKPNRTLPNPPDLTKPTNQQQGERFERIWKDYPNKDGMKLARRHFLASVVSDQDWSDIQRALKGYLNSEKVRKGFIKNGSTWFNNWRDWINTEKIQESDADRKARLLKAMLCLHCKPPGKLEKLEDGTVRCASCNIDHSKHFNGN